MAYKRRYVVDGVTIMNKDLYDNLQDGIDDLDERVSKIEQEMHVEVKKVVVRDILVVE